MKKNKIVWILCFALLLLAAFAGCQSAKGPKIGVPDHLFVENGVLTWDAVSGAIGYEILLDEEEFSSEEARFELSIFDYDDHTISVRAVTHDGKGAYSASITYARTRSSDLLPQLSAPYGISMTSNRLLWNSVLNNNGYKIFFDGKVLTAPRNATYFDLTFPRDGTFYIQMQTVGDGVTYASSKISASYAVTVKDGKAPLKKLSAQAFTFDPTDKTIVWTNRYSASAVSYEIYKDSDPLPFSVIPADESKTKMSFSPELTGSLVSYRMRLVSNNGLYSPSDFSEDVTFPLVDQAPSELKLLPNDSKTGYRLVWSERDLKDAYVVELDGASYTRVAGESYAIPSDISVGEHTLRVRTEGDNVYYRASVYSADYIFFADKEGMPFVCLTTPTISSVTVTQGVFEVRFSADERADHYRLVLTDGEKTASFVLSSPFFTLSSSELNGEAISAADSLSAALALSLLEKGVAVSVRAESDSPLYVSSPYSAEAFVIWREEEEGEPSEEEEEDPREEADPAAIYRSAPIALSFGASGLTWEALSDAEAGYELILDGESILTAQNYYPDAIRKGLHTARVRVKSEELSLFSEEIFFYAPSRLSAPTDLSITSGILTFQSESSASSYELYLNGEVIATLASSERAVLLSVYIKTDGRYTLYLKSKSYSSNLSDSGRSEEISYVKTDGDYGTELKPYEPSNAVELLSLLHSHPDAYYRLSSGTYDFAECDLSILSSLSFSGKIDGNGAVLKNLELSKPLFETIEGAKVKNLSIFLSANDFAFSQNGLFSSSMRSTEFDKVDLTIAGSGRASDGMLGLLSFEIAESELCDLTMDLSDFSVFAENGALGVALFAYDADMTIKNATISGTVSVTGNGVTFSGLYGRGNALIDGCDLLFDAVVNARDGAFVSGGTTGGTLTATGARFGASVRVRASSLSYAGVSFSGADLTASSVTGSLTAEVNEAEAYGVSLESAYRLRSVSVTPLLSVKAKERANVAALSERVSQETLLSEITFAPSFSLVSDRLRAAGATLFADVPLDGSFAAQIEAKSEDGGSAEIGGLYLTGQGGKETIDLSLSIENFASAFIGGVCLSGAEGLSVSGSVSLASKNAGEVTAGGVLTEGSIFGEIKDFSVTVSLSADSVTFGGIAPNADVVELSLTSFAVGGTVEAEDAFTGGAFYSVADFSEEEDLDIAINLSVKGNGTQAGFIADAGRSRIRNLTISGSLSSEGEGSLYGVSESCGAIASVYSSLSLSAKGASKIAGIANTAASVTSVSLSDAEFIVASRSATVVGGVFLISNGKAAMSLSSVTFSIQNEDTESEVELFGITDSVKEISGVTISDCTIETQSIGSFTFGALCRNASEAIENVSLSYSLSSSARSNAIGGAVYSLSGTVRDLFVGKAETYVSLSVEGECRLGGIAVESRDATVSGGGAYISVTADGKEENESFVGGAVASLLSGRSLTFSSFASETEATLSGKGKMTFGGTAAEVFGRLTGASPKVKIHSLIEGSVVGGVVGSLSGGDAADCRAEGSIETQGAAGGIAGEIAGATLRNASSHTLISVSDGEAGGLAARIERSSLYNVYSTATLKDKGAGFFYTGDSVSIHDGYFAGAAVEYALAKEAVFCQSEFLFLDASLKNMIAVESGSLNYALRTLSYGYGGSDFVSGWTSLPDRYPFLTSLGEIVAEERDCETLSSVTLSDGTDLYSILPAVSFGAAPSVSWIDDSGLLLIENGVVTVLDNGQGTLFGYLSGGVKAFEVPYVAEGFVAFEGEGTSESPYLIGDMRYFNKIPAYLERNPSAVFLLSLEESEIRDFEFPELFAEDRPFTGVIDFSCVRFLSPSIPSSGVVGFIAGGTVKNLTIEDVLLSGNAVAEKVTDGIISGIRVSGAANAPSDLVKQAVRTEIKDVSFVLTAEGGGSFTLVDQWIGGEGENLSFYFETTANEEVFAYLVRSSQNLTVDRAQTLLQGKEGAPATFAFVGQDENSAFSRILSAMIFPDSFDSDLTAAGLALSANGTEFDRAVALASVPLSFSLPLLIADGNAIYQDVLAVLSPYSGAAADSAAGVSSVSVFDFSDAANALSEYASDGFFPPAGLSSFGQGEEIFFTVYNEETGEPISELLPSGVRSLSLSSVLSVSASSTLSSIIGFSFEGSAATVIGDELVFTSEGSGTLVIRNLFGEEVRIEVALLSFGGFEAGSGTESDPYLVSSFDDFKLISEFENACFLLNENISGSVEEPIRFSGTLSGTGSVRAQLIGNSLFESVRGKIEGLTFVLSPNGVKTFDGNGGFFASSLENAILSDLTITVENTEIEMGDDASFGLLFAETGSELSINDLTLNAPSVSIIAGNNVSIGAVIGKAQDTLIENLTVDAQIEIESDGEITIGSIGTLEESEEVALLSGANIRLALTVSAGSVTAGGAVGRANGRIERIQAETNFTLTASDRAVAGGVSGENNVRIRNVSASGSIEAEGETVILGGITGESNGSLEDGESSLSVSAKSNGISYAGGIAGKAAESIVKGKVSSSLVEARSLSSETALENAYFEIEEIRFLAVAGGAVGMTTATVSRVETRETTVRSIVQTADESFFSLAGGAVGLAFSVRDSAVYSGEISAEGGSGFAGGAIGALYGNAARLLVGSVSLTANTVGGAVAAFSFETGASLESVFSLAEVGDGEGGIVGKIFLSGSDEEFETGKVSASYYLFGLAVKETETPSLVSNNEKLSDASDFYGSAIYSALDDEIWNLQEGALPSLKE